ncbi:hypothetical protein [Candidatus Chlorohelix sp.]|uniref:hypothetical protein n=1 Tax=Candidatus Chlorohelix sp. TaxID=3139201 RepID=UPI00304E3E6C
MSEVTPDGHKPKLPKFKEFDWLEREAALDPTLDFEAQRQFGGATGVAFTCLGYIGIFFVGLLGLIPGVPIMAIAGIPFALLLGILTYFNYAHLQEKWRKIPLIKNLPGLNGAKLLQSFLVTFYLVILSLLCLGLMVVTQRR